MADSVLKLSEIKLALKREELNFKIQNSELNGTEDSIIFIDRSSKATLRGKIVRSFNEGEVHHWPLLSHENVARLIDILRVRDTLYLYFTIHHDITLKNIVHDQNFIYDSACFNRKLSYAKGIYSGLSYLHEKSLSLLNLCDDNIVISIVNDTAIITNFDHITCKNKVTRSSLNVPEMYMPPETEKGEFDSIKADVWASGILMLDMFLAHMVPWAIVGYKPKKVINIVDNISLDLLQAANVGSIVTGFDLTLFKAFLKRIFRQNPLERIPAKYAYIASFLNRGKCKVFRNSYESVSIPEDMLPLDYPNLISPIYFNPTYNPSSNYILPKAQKEEVERIDLADVPANEAQQGESPAQIDKNEAKIDIPLTGTSKTSINLKKAGNLKIFPSSDKIIDTFANPETPVSLPKPVSYLHKIPKSWQTINEWGIKIANELSYQSKSLSFIKPTSDNIAFASVHGNLKNSDLGLNFLFNNKDDSNDEIEIDSNNVNSDVIVESDGIKAETGEKLSKIPETRHMPFETKNTQQIPRKLERNNSMQVFEKPVVKPLRNSKVPPLFLSPEIKSALNKIIFLRRIFVCIQWHNRIFISNEFGRQQKKILKNYKFLLHIEDFKLREMLMKKYKLKFEDVGKLMKYVNLAINGRQYEKLLINESFFKINENRFLQKQEMKDALKSNDVKYCPDDKLKNAKIIPVRPERNCSHCKAVENAEINRDRKWEINYQVHCEIPKNVWKRPNVAENKFVAASTLECGKKIKSERTDVEMNGKVKYRENVGKYENPVYEVQRSSGAIPKKAYTKDSTCKEKEKELNTKEKEEKSPKKPVEKNNNKMNKNMNEELEPRKKIMNQNTDKKLDHKDSNKEKMNENREINKKEIKKTADKKPKIDKKKMDEDKDKKEKKLRDIKKLQESKRSWWFSMFCPGGRAEDPVPIVDTLCETCKINLKIV